MESSEQFYELHLDFIKIIQNNNIMTHEFSFYYSTNYITLEVGSATIESSALALGLDAANIPLAKVKSAPGTAVVVSVE